jgi:hypothetical protein
MRYHDFHIEGYTVSCFGREIVLHLIFDYPEQAKVRSDIRFSEVAAYHFVHTGGAIMIEIDELPLEDLLKKNGNQLAEWDRMVGGYVHWKDDRAEYRAVLEAEGYKGWQLESAIGFEGFVIAKSVSGEILE